MRRAHLLFVLCLTGCQKSGAVGDLESAVTRSVPISSAAPNEAERASVSPPPPSSDLLTAANQVRDALIARDMPRLAQLVHPERGVRFSPYAYVHPEADVVLKPDELRPALASIDRRDWGSYDGSGDPINLTFNDYFDRFVLIPNLESAEPALNRLVQTGNTTSNLSEVYPDSFFVEYHYPGSDMNMDWSSLRLVFVRERASLYLVGVVHDQWTI